MTGHQMANQIDACISQIELANIWLTGYGERLIYDPLYCLFHNGLMQLLTGITGHLVRDCSMEFKSNASCNLGADIVS